MTTDISVHNRVMSYYARYDRAMNNIYAMLLETSSKFQSAYL